MNLGKVKEIIYLSSYEFDNLAKELGISSVALINRLDNKVPFTMGEVHRLAVIFQLKNPRILLEN